MAQHSYRIVSRDGIELGTYTAASSADALDAMAREAWYRDQADAAEVAGAFEGTVEDLGLAPITVTVPGAKVGAVPPYSAELDRATGRVTIRLGGAWVGAGQWTSHGIADCSVDMGEDIYSALDAELRAAGADDVDAAHAPTYRIVVGERGNEQGHVIAVEGDENEARRVLGAELDAYGNDGWGRIEWTSPDREGWEDTETRMVQVETMPEHLVESHRTAGNFGRYPSNGAVRRWVAADEADEIVEADADGYARIVE